MGVKTYGAGLVLLKINNMKRLTTFLLGTAIATLTSIAGAYTVPYSSDMMVNFAVDEGWTTVNEGGAAQGFGYFKNGDDGMDSSVPGTAGGVRHAYDSDYDANCWIISPGITLQANKNYVVTFWGKSRGNDSEKLELWAAKSSATADLKRGQQLYRNEAFKYPDSFTKVESQFTPTEDGDYYFGLHCFSDANSYTLYLTGFSIEEAGSSSSSGGEDPAVEAKTLPYATTFSSKAEFDEWTSLAGPAAGTTSPWTYSTYSSSAEFDASYNLPEDNYFVSPALKFSAPGDYLITLQATIYGDIEVLLGSTLTDLSSYQVVGTTGAVSSYDTKFEFPFTLDNQGDYYVAFRAKSDNGSYMGYRFTEVRVKQNLMVPALITDLKAKADANDGLQTKLTWTEPTLDQIGGQLESLVKTEVYRNGTLIATIDAPAIGSQSEYTDNVPEGGVYTYSVKAYNANGCYEESPLEVSAGYVGRPEATMPYSFEMGYSTSTEELNKYTYVDANGDGNGWEAYSPGSWSAKFQSKMPSNEVEADDYLVTPYLHLTPGYYKFEADVNSRYNNFEIGYMTQRNKAETFTVIKSYENIEEWGESTYTVLFEIAEEGDYCMAFHHYGCASDGVYLEVNVSKLSLQSQPKLPQHVTDLTLEQNGNSLYFTWNYPTKDVLGKDLAPDTALGFTLYADGAFVYEVQPDASYKPGQYHMQGDDALNYTGDHIFTVVAMSAEGSAEGPAPWVASYVGDALDLPYSEVDFANWKLFNDEGAWYNWMKVDNYIKIDYSYGTVQPTYAMSPMFNLEDNMDYRLTFTAENYGYYDMTMGVCAAQARVLGAVNTIEEVLLPASSDAAASGTYEVMFSASSTAPMAEGEADENALPVVAPGKVSFGFAPVSTGTAKVTGFSLEKVGETGIETVAALADGIAYSNGVVYFPESARSIVICDLSGKVLYSAEKASEVRLDASGVVVVSANVDGKAATLKLNLR